MSNSDSGSGSGAAFDSLKNAWAPALRAQQEALKAIESFGRFQAGLAGDYMDWTMAQAKANLTAGSATDLAAVQTALAGQFGEKFKARVQEYVGLATAAQASFNQVLGEATASVASTFKKST